MDILLDVLKQLNFKEQPHFKFKLNEEEEYKVSPYIWENYKSQVFLLIKLDYKNLPLVLSRYFLAKLATAFCMQDFYRSEMDKNTSLIIKSLGDPNALKDNSEKIKIEDDPHYFKKYVFTYTEQAENKACEYFEKRANEVGDGFSLISEIQNVLLNGDEFEKYKNNPLAQEVYSYVVELTTKIPVLPLKIESVSSFKPLVDFFNDELKKVKKPVKVAEIEKLLSMDIDFNDLNTDKVLSLWQECLIDGEV